MNLKEMELNCPKWLPSNTQYLCYMGSIAYGVSTDASDLDVYGFTIPPKSYVFPENYIHGFDTPQEFNQWQCHHVKHKEKEYDFTIRSIVRYFKLCIDCNPDTIDSLFVPLNCIAQITQIGNIVRENRHLFLSKKLFGKYKGYSYSQLHKAESKSVDTGSKRAAIREKYGWDTKFLYHVVRLLSEAEQLLVECDLVLDEKGRREHMKAIRRGEVTPEDVRKWATSKEKDLETAYVNSKLPNTPRIEEIKALLIRCLEIHYGNIPVVKNDHHRNLLLQIQKLVESVN